MTCETPFPLTISSNDCNGLPFSPVSGDEKHLVKQSPCRVFNHLASSLWECSEVFESASIFYLLDDVSTRYLEARQI